MYGRNAAMQFRYGSIVADGHRSAAPEMWKHADGKHHGYGTDDQHYAFWHVPVDVKPNGSFGHCCSDGRTHANAMRAGDYSPLGSTGTGQGHEYARPHQQCEVHVCLGRGDLSKQSQWLHDDTGKVKREE